MANENKEKKITLDFSEELINLIRERTEANEKESNEKLKEVKELILTIVEREINHIDKEFEYVSAHEEKYNRMIKLIDAWADVIKYW